VGVEPRGLSTVCSPMHTAVAGWGQGAGTQVRHRGGCESVSRGSMALLLLCCGPSNALGGPGTSSGSGCSKGTCDSW
jgi:hypothetical protein